ncbi:MAG: four helix bundle protein, partial [Planctomyces sp.]
MAVQHYRELLAWQVARDLAEQCYRLTKGFPAEDRYGMTTQMRR